MKKQSIALAVAGALGAGAVASAATVSEFANGLLVPRATFQDANRTTAVGLNTCAAGTVFWTFFDQDSGHVTDGQFDMTRDDQASYIWAEEAGFGLAGTEGYLVFLFDEARGTPAVTDGIINASDAACLTGNAFFVDTTANDVAFVPSLPLYLQDFLASDKTTVNLIDNPTTMDEDSINRLTAGAAAGPGSGVSGSDTIYMRYFIDGAPGGRDTALVFWSAPDVSGSYTVNMFDDEQNRKSVNFTLPNAELNVVDPETIVGRDPGHLDGFIKFNLPKFWDMVPNCNSSAGSCTGPANTRESNEPDGLFSFSVVQDPTFGAAQTLINPIIRRNGVSIVTSPAPAP